VRRRELLALSICDPPHAPVDMERLNKLAAAYNQYVDRLKDGILDLRQWSDVVRSWEKLK
jgi:hypothetical protein